jgi:heme exporter protein C
MSIWEYANPRKFMETSSRVLPWIVGLAALCLGVGLIWGFFFTPDDFRQGSTVKIIYIHVPGAMMAINAWLMMLVTSLIWLIRRHHVSALAAKA